MRRGSFFGTTIQALVLKLLFRYSRPGSTRCMNDWDKSPKTMRTQDVRVAEAWPHPQSNACYCRQYFLKLAFIHTCLRLQYEGATLHF